MANTQDFTILQGKTFSRVLRWESEPFLYKAITGVAKSAPARLTVAGHGLPTGWRAAVISVGGMRELNAKNSPPRAPDFQKITSVSANVVDLNAVDSSGFTTYTSGGYLKAYTPVSLSGFTARMQVRATAAATGDPLLSLTTENSRIALDDALKTITLTLSATDTAALTFLSGVYDLEMVSGAGVVTQLLCGNVIVTNEVTR